MVKKILIAALIVGVLLAVIVPSASAGIYVPQSGMDFAVRFYEPWYEPHYGVGFWAPVYPASWHYTGAGGDPPGIATWDLWGSGGSVVLVPKAFLLGDRNRSFPNNYWALVLH